MYEAHDLREAIELAKSGKESMVICPAHADQQASLHVTRGDTHPVIMTCHAQCTVADILAAAELEPSIIMAERTNDETETQVWTPVKDKRSGKYLTATNVYPYHSEDGSLLYEVVRVKLPDGGKTFRQRQPDQSEKFGWKWNMDGARRVLYRLPEVLKAKTEGRMIYLVEGEKDVETLRSMGECATTSPMGAGKWISEYTTMLQGANVTIIADADATGRAHARTVRELLMKAGCNVTLCESAEGKDVTDHVASGHALADLVETMPEQEEVAPLYGIDVLDVIKRPLGKTSFVVPGVLAVGERLLITGFEGQGKSMFTRQFGVCVAAGLHPWHFGQIEPQTVLYLDAENHPDQIQASWADLIGLAAKHGRILERGMLSVIEAWDEDIDLCSEEGEAWLVERMHAYKPKLLVMGPIYNLTAEDVTTHAVVGRLKQVVNKARALYGTAVVMEHHAPLKGPNDLDRSVRPYGSSTFLKWPDYGYGFKPVKDKEGLYEFQKLRGNRVRERYFPAHMRNGKPNTMEFPWVECMVDDEGNVY